MNYGFPGTTYDIGYYIARWVFVSASVWLFVYCVVLIPLDVFAKDRQLPLMRRVNANAPPTRFRGYFHEFREYEAVHVFFWALKDTVWIWSEPGFSETIQDAANAALCDEQQLSPCDIVANVTAFCLAEDPPLSPCAPDDVYPGSFVAGNMCTSDLVALAKSLRDKTRRDETSALTNRFIDSSGLLALRRGLRDRHPAHPGPHVHPRRAQAPVHRRGPRRDRPAVGARGPARAV